MWDSAVNMLDVVCFVCFESITAKWLPCDCHTSTMTWCGPISHDHTYTSKCANLEKFKIVGKKSTTTLKKTAGGPSALSGWASCKTLKWLCGLLKSVADRSVWSYLAKITKWDSKDSTWSKENLVSILFNNFFPSHNASNKSNKCLSTQSHPCSSVWRCSH